MVIGVTDNMGSEHKLQQYLGWLRQGNARVEIVTLSYHSDNLSAAASCDGIVLTGGGDVDPRLYGGDTKNPKVYGVDSRRDDFERKVIDTAIRSGKPLLGICRGLQIVNVHLGGTLIQDLADAGHPGHETGKEAERRHAITLEDHSFARAVIGTAAGEINSYHHQAADEPAPGLRITGRSADGVAEALEPVPGTIPSFLLLVQWHPERMNDRENPFCSRLRTSLYNAIEML